MKRFIGIPTGRQPYGRRRSAGASMVEFAVSVVLFLASLMGIMECSLGLYTYHFVADAAREASRYAMVRGATCSGWAAACPASASDIQTYVQGLAPEGVNPASLTVTTTWAPNNSPGSAVSVTVEYDFSIDFPLLPANAMLMKSQSQMVITQ